MKFNLNLINILRTRLILIILGLIWGGLIILRGERVYLEWKIALGYNYKIRFLILFDLIRIIFISAVSLISLRVLMFRKSYISNESRNSLFHKLLYIFITRMFLLILRPSILSCLLGWDGLGLSSYLLVIFYSNTKAYNSGIITAITNRFGDVLIMLVIRVQVINLNWGIYSSVFQPYTKLWGLLFVLATFTKRAQLPFSAWLPAAIAAPTPVSSLVHSSTLVTAGVYLLIRYDVWFFNFNNMYYLFMVGRLTTLLASFAAFVETDLKKMVALSTLRQLGLIVSFLGVGLTKIRFVHLVAHAFFKALIFIRTGKIIHNSNSGQDLRFIGGFFNTFRNTKRFLLLANFRLIGLPFMSAFFVPSAM